MEIGMKTILVVDDELCQPAAAKIFSENYPIENFTYVFVSDESEMLKELEEDETVCLILLDIRFEDIAPDHGISILKQLIDLGWPVPVIMMTTISKPETIIQSWDLGAQGYVVKWSSNPYFYEELKAKVLKFATIARPSSKDLVERRRNKIRAQSNRMLKKYSKVSIDNLIGNALQFKEEINAELINSFPLPADFQNYVRGWNATDEELAVAEKERHLLYINMDFGDGCTLRCPHCFTHEGAIDAQGRDPIPYDRIKEAVLEGKELGLKCIRILGRGEPTQWIAGGNKSPGLTPAKGEDFIDFITFLHDNDIIPLVFTRGQIIGDDRRVQWAYGGTHGITEGQDLIKTLFDLDVSLFMGLSSIFSGINNEMVGLPENASYNYDSVCRRAIKLSLARGFNIGDPTRFAVEMPITNLNIMEMAVRYILFQALNISPCTNVYMVAGRAMTYGLGEINSPSQEQFLDMYSTIHRFSQRMGINAKIGAYAGTKECHDISNGVYLTLNGDIYPCPGYEGVHSFIGSLRTNSLKEIWENNPYGGHPQSICPPKIKTFFPPDFDKQVESYLNKNVNRYDDLFDRICTELGVKI